MNNKEKKQVLEKRNRVIVIKVTDSEYKKIKTVAQRCSLTVSSFGRARFIGYEPKQGLTEEEFERLGDLALCRVDMVNFANALSGLTRDEKLQLFRNHRQMYDWYCLVAPITNAVVEYMQFVQKANIFQPPSMKDVTKVKLV